MKKLKKTTRKVVRVNSVKVSYSDKIQLQIDLLRSLTRSASGVAEIVDRSATQVKYLRLGKHSIQKDTIELLEKEVKRLLSICKELKK